MPNPDHCLRLHLNNQERLVQIANTKVKINAENGPRCASTQGVPVTKKSGSTSQ